MENFKIEICSDVDFEENIVYISDERSTILTLNCDRGIENAEIIFFPDVFGTHNRKTDYSTFLKVIEKGFEKLKEANSIKE